MGERCTGFAPCRGMVWFDSRPGCCKSCNVPVPSQKPPDQAAFFIHPKLQQKPEPVLDLPECRCRWASRSSGDMKSLAFIFFQHLSGDLFTLSTPLFKDSLNSCSGAAARQSFFALRAVLSVSI